MIAPGTVLAGRYRVVRHIGSGGMASVYLTEDTTLGRRVAVKRIHAAPESELGRRIRREARLGAGVRHPNVVTVFDVAADGEALLLVMEFVDGETLADALRRGPLEPARAVALLRPLAAALDALHAQGIVHRDVKPANVLVGRGGAVKLSDLGVATSSEATRITQTGGVIGTAAYMAPEQFEPGPATAAADVYALAVLAFELLAGRRAFAGATPFDVLGRTREGAHPPDVREHQPELPEAATQALRRGMATRVEERTPTASALVDELEAALSPGAGAATAPAPPPAPVHPREPAQPVEPVDEAPVAPATSAGARRPPPAPAPARRRSRAPLLALLAIVALAGVVVAVILGSGGQDPAPERAERGATETAATGTTATGAASTPAATASGPSTPTSAVRAFYERAATGRLEDSWALAGPGMKAAFGGSFASFRATLGSLRSIEFRRLEQTARDGDGATVAIETVARHTDRTDRCSGDLRAVRGDGDAWIVGAPAVDCTST